MVKTDMGATRMNEIRSILNDMKREEAHLLAGRNRTLHRDKVFSLSVGLTGFAFLVLISVLATLRIRALLDVQDEANKKLRYLASHDSLTGLATRRLGLEYMSFALSEARRYKHKVAVLFIDLDGFKPVNDRYGHDVGDCLLQGVAQRLTNCVREIDMVSRVGGDEFIIVMSKIDSRESIAQIGQKLIDVLARPFPIGGEDISVGASIGMALYPDHGQEPEKLFKCADEAMYGIKGKGKNRFAFATDSIEGVKGPFPLTA